MADKNKPEKDLYPEPCPLPPEELAAAYAKVKAEFSAADLQRFTEEDEGILFEDILAELEELDGHEEKQE